MNSLRRMLDVLSLIRPGQPILDIDTLCRQLGYSPASAYRYVRELNEVGLLVRLPAGYALGPRIIEMDLLMRENDPLLRSSRSLLDAMTQETGLHGLLSELYENKVINIHQVDGLDGDPLNFGRGRPMDLFRSATSRVILANLSPRHLRRVYDQHADHPDLHRLGGDWKQFSKAMLQIRKQGYCLSHGELDADKTGLAAPLFDDKKRVLGSITLVGSHQRFAAYREDFLANKICAAAREITTRIGVQAGIQEP